MPQYRTVVGLDTPTKRIEAGEVTSDIPEKDVKWLLSFGYIQTLDGKGEKLAPVKTETTETFKLDAKDGDGDGLVQDSTPFERPIDTPVVELEKEND